MPPYSSADKPCLGADFEQEFETDLYVSYVFETFPFLFRKFCKKNMKDEKIDLLVNLNIGKKEFTSYTMDLTKKYIEINSDYRT